MAITRMFEDNEKIVQLCYKGWPITPKMKKDDPTELLAGLSQAVEVAYQKTTRW